MVEHIKDFHAAIGVPFNEYAEALLQKKDMRYPWGPGKWSFFGGEVEPPETPKAAFQREFKEETDITLDNVVHFNDYPFSQTVTEQGLHREGTFHMFVAQYSRPLRDLRLTEGAGAAFYAPEELSSITLFDGLKEILLEFYEELKRYGNINDFFKILRERETLKY